MKLESLHKVIKLRLKERGNTINDLIEYLKISRQGYTKAIKNNVSLTQLEQIASFLKLPVPELLLPIYYTEKEARAMSAAIDYLRNAKH